MKQKLTNILGNKMKTKRQKIIFEVIYIAIFVAISVFVGLHHEHWADEAQSWLIARDNSFTDIVKAIRYEGTPPLWQMLLKVCIMCGLKYNQLYILTTALTVLGIIFLHKNDKVPLSFKILLPYTYFIFFQYTVIARSYNLLFPILMIIAYIYPNKEKHLIKYGIFLFLLMNISSHGYFLAVGFWAEYFIEELRKLLKEDKKLSKETITFISILAIAFCIVAICVIPLPDCSSGLGGRVEWYSIISGSLYTSTENIITNAIGLVLFAIVLAKLIKGRICSKNYVPYNPKYYMDIIYFWECMAYGNFVFDIFDGCNYKR